MQSTDDRLPTLLFLLIITLIHIPESFCQGRQYDACGQANRCANVDLTYPFWGGNRPDYCGYPGFEVTCQGNVSMISVSQILYRILDSPNTTAHTIRVAREDLFVNNCPTAPRDQVLNFSIFSYSNIQNVTLFYGCPRAFPSPNEFNCNGSGSNTSSRFVISNAPGSNNIPDSCAANITVPIDAAAASNLVNSGALRGALTGGFTLEYEANNTNCQRCSQSGGRCGYNTYSNSFVCYCVDRAHDLECNRTTSAQSGNGQSSWLQRRKELVIIGLSIGIPLIISSVGLIYYLAKRYSWWEAAIYWKWNDGNNRLVEEFMRNYGSIAPKQYTYSEIKKMTNSFAGKLGHGGYGCVYRGKLSDGRLVAVKVLNGNKGNGQEFINEVATISRTSHVNVVTLLGFCYNRNKRALIYEFMPNGSLDKFICKKGSSLDITKGDFLDWKLLYEIAVGIARGLEYLHQGCNNRIVHFDIKPQNILLDADFCPKISDFGLAKLCQRKESVLSMSNARGTIGYIAPEVFLRNFGGASHKSDVYSYGMMVLEMVGLRRKSEIDSQQTSENYFPNWIYEHVELDKELPLEGVRNEDEEETARKMILVGLWCIQTYPADRPSISKVVEMLEDSLQSIQLPPKPFQNSPAAINIDQESWTTSSIS